MRPEKNITEKKKKIAQLMISSSLDGLSKPIATVSELLALFVKMSLSSRR